jgi:hypothetical protein
VALAAERWLTSLPLAAPTENAAWAPPASKIAREFALLPTMLRAFQAGLGHFVVPYAFEVRFSTADPSNPPVREADGLVSDVREIPWAAALPVWAPTLRWYNIGRLLNKFATSATLQAEHPEVAESLRGMGFPLGAAYHKLKWDTQIMAALQTYHHLHGQTKNERAP